MLIPKTPYLLELAQFGQFGHLNETSYPGTFHVSFAYREPNLRTWSRHSIINAYVVKKDYGRNFSQNSSNQFNTTTALMMLCLDQVHIDFPSRLGSGYANGTWEVLENNICPKWANPDIHCGKTFLDMLTTWFRTVFGDYTFTLTVRKRLATKFSFACTQLLWPNLSFGRSIGPSVRWLVMLSVSLLFYIILRH